MISAAYISTTSAFKIAGMRVAIGLSVIGALIFLMALFGGCGSIAENRFVLIVFIIYTATLFLIQIIITAWTFAQRNQLESLLSTGWTKALDEEKQAVQTTFTCCGFSSLTDKAVPPCPTGSTEGCFAAIKDKISHDWKWLSAAAVIICLLQIVALGLAYILNKGIKKAVASNTINRAAR
jgi:Na+(H+)/acetate symporter ActP